MSGTSCTPHLRLLAATLSLVAGAAQATTASGIDGLSLDTVIPRLEQSNSHLPAKQTVLQSLRAMLLQNSGEWTLSAQDSLGAFRLSNTQGDKVVALPVGGLLSDPDRADGLQCYGSGLCEAATSHVISRYNATLDDPAGFVTAIHRYDPQATVLLNQEGNLQVRINGRNYLTQVAWNVLPGTASQAFASDNEGLWFTGSTGKQALYPVLASFERLLAVARQLDPAATALGDHRGRVVLVMQGKRYTLTPDWEVIATPAVHANEDYWLDNGLVYVNYRDGTSQAIVVQ